MNLEELRESIRQAERNFEAAQRALSDAYTAYLEALFTPDAVESSSDVHPTHP